MAQWGGVGRVLLLISQREGGWSSPDWKLGAPGSSRHVWWWLCHPRPGLGSSGLSPVPAAPQGWDAGLVPRDVALLSFSLSCSLSCGCSCPESPSPLLSPPARPIQSSDEATVTFWRAFCHRLDKICPPGFSLKAQAGAAGVVLPAPVPCRSLVLP